MTICRNFEFEKETKRTIRFKEIENDLGFAIGTLYVQKDKLDEIHYQDGDILTVTISID